MSTKTWFHAGCGLALCCLLLLLTSLCPAGATPAASPYHLRPGDILQITVPGHDELTFNSSNPIEIRPDGRFSYPFAGEIVAEGSTVEQITVLLVDALSQHLRAPQVAVNVIKYGEEEIYVLGEVNRPGAFALPRGRDLGIREALALAGGLTPGASLETARLFRAGQPPNLINLGKILAAASEVGAVLLQPGDTLVIERQNRVTVIGEVEHPGTYQLPDNGKVSDALAMAGGFAKDYGTGGTRANRTQAALIRADQTVVPVNIAAILSGLHPEADIRMHTGDTLLIPEGRNQIAVLGQVRNSGSYYLGGDEKLSSVLAMAGGVTPDADLQHIRIISPDGMFSTVNYEPMLREGAVEPDRLCAAGDTVIVPTNRNRVAVFGAVNRPGVYVIETGDTILDLMGKAGGIIPQKSAPQHTILLRQEAPDGEPMTINLQAMMQGRAGSGGFVAQNGDVIFVPESHKLHWQDWTKLLSSIVNVLWIFDEL